MPSSPTKFTTKQIFEGGLVHRNEASAPGSPVEGEAYWNTSSKTFFLYDGTAFISLGGAGGTVLVQNNGTPLVGSFTTVNFSTNLTAVDGGSGVANVTGAAGGGTPNHNDTLSIDGGTSGQYFHLTSAQHTALTGAGNTTLHTHDIYSKVDGSVAFTGKVAGVATVGGDPAATLVTKGYADALGGGASDHGALTGLGDVIDHPGYTTIDGSRPFTGNQAFGGNEIIDFVIERLGTNPAFVVGDEGRIIYRTDLNDYQYNDGSSWISLFSGSLPLVTDTSDGAMTKTDKIKMDSIEAGARTYPVFGPTIEYTLLTDLLDITGQLEGRELTDTTQNLSLTADTARDVDIKMGDAAGVQKVSFRTSAGAEVASINSSGTISGTSIFGTSAALSGNLQLTAGGSVITTANGNIALSPDGTGIISATANISGTGLLLSNNIELTAGGSVITTANGNIALAPNGSGIVTSTATFSGTTITLSGDVTLTNGGTIFTTANGDLTLTPNGTGIISATAPFSGTTLTLSGTISATTAILSGGIALTGGDTISTTGNGNIALAPNGTGIVTSTATFSGTTITLSGDVTLTNGGTIASTNNGNVTLAPNGTGIAQVGAATIIVEGDARLADHRAASFHRIDLLSILDEADYRGTAPTKKARVGATNPSTVLKVFAFAETFEDFMVFQYRIPADLDGSGTVSIDLDWLADAEAADDVVWKMHYAAIAAGESFDVALTTKSITVTADAAADTMVQSIISETVATMGLVAGDTLLLHLSRESGNVADTLTGDAELITATLRIPRA